MKTDRNMRIFRVGGCIRDRLMGIFHPKDVDYVVTGATEEQLLAAKPFGKKLVKIEAQNFPVYHDSEGNEWSLARRERKVGQGYHGFEVEFGPEVTLEDGTVIQSLNKELLQKFIGAGYNLSDDYAIEELIEFFRHTIL